MKLKKLFDSPEKWTQGTLARRHDGKPVSIYDSAATCFCLFGGLRKCYGYTEDAGSIVRAITGYIKRELIPLYNDSPERTFEDIKKLVNDLDI